MSYVGSLPINQTGDVNNDPVQQRNKQNAQSHIGVSPRRGLGIGSDSRAVSDGSRSHPSMTLGFVPARGLTPLSTHWASAILVKTNLRNVHPKPDGSVFFKVEVELRYFILPSVNHKPDRPIGCLPVLNGHLALWYNISRPVQVANKHVSEAVLCNTGSQDTRSTSSKDRVRRSFFLV